MDHVLSMKHYYVGALVYFTENKAKEGGGVFLESNSKLYVLRKVTLSFTNELRRALMVYNIYALTFTANSADYGGAIFVADDTHPGTCASTSYMIQSTTAECFLQVLRLRNAHLNREVYINSDVSFKENLANISGSTLFGGLLDRCTVSPFAEVHEKNILDRTSYFGDTELNSISSGPVRVCFCRNGQPNCSYQPLVRNVMKGEKITVTLSAVDQINHTLSNVTIHTSLLSKFGGLGENQLNQTTEEACTDLHFEIFSPNASAELIMYADGPCKDAIPSQRRVHIQFSPCSCPIGFQPKLSEATRCTCECHSKLENYVTECDPLTATLVRRGSFWITYGYDNILIKYTKEYLIYPYCPLDYCHPSSSAITFSLNESNGADAQCANIRSGRLCGSCKPGLSLSLGSSRCLLCPSYWPALLVVIVMAAVFAGIALVVIILVLNLTVAVGTINGIIFYANIVNANSSTFLPFDKSNFITVFTAWFNLEFGLDSCFFEGMDAYGKILIQLAFVAYLISLIVLIIVITERSSRFAWLIGRKNPVATLATLILLSYAKVLNTTTTSLSFIIHDIGSDSSSKSVVIGCLLMCIVFFTAGVAYAVLLFTWQWLLRYQNKQVLTFIKYIRFSLFIEPYHAPYTFEHRYWTGLLLFIRAILYTISAASILSHPGIILLATGIAMVSLLLLKGFLKGNIYQKWPLEILEIFSYMNIICLCLAQLFAIAIHRNAGIIIAYISGSLTVALFIIVLAYHIYSELLSKTVTRLLKALALRQSKQGADRLLESDSNVTDDSHVNQPTHSEVDRPVEIELPLVLAANEQEHHDHAMVESIEVDLPYHSLEAEVHEVRVTEWLSPDNIRLTAVHVA